MRSLGSAGAVSRARQGAEWVSRIVVLGALAWYLFQALRPRAGSRGDAATSAELRAKLVRWSTSAAPAQAHVTLAYPPPLTERDWVAALAGAGTSVRWRGDALLPTAVSMEPIADPAGGADLAVAAPARSPVILRDALGAFDTIVAGAQGVRVYLPSPPALAEAVVGPVVATARLRDSLRLGRLLLLADAGWEAKFVAAALEERGWKVDALLAFSPKGQGDVRQGRIAAIDTATYSAILALDTVAGRYADQIVRYVRSGGGLVLWSAAAEDPRLAAIAPARAGAVLPAESSAPTDAAPRQGLKLAPLRQLNADALTLEERRGSPAVVAWRLEKGRVVQTGYIDTWRWRMAGLDSMNRTAPDAHRAWLARLVATVAYTGHRPRPGPAADAAPLATLVDQLGPASALPPRLPPPQRSAWIFGLILMAALLEWTSRRWRGVP